VSRIQLLIHLSSRAVFVVITTLSIHYSFALLLQAQNLPLQQIIPTLIDFWYTRTTFTDHWTGPDLPCSSVYFFSSFVV